MKTNIRTAALTSIGILLLLGGANAAFASTSQALSGAAAGGVTNLGNQKYAINGGAILCADCFASFTLPNGQSIVFAPSTNVGYQLAANVIGQTVTGAAQFAFNGMTIDGLKEQVTAKISISGFDIPSATFVGNSVLPFFFLGQATVTAQGSGSTQTFQTTMEMENPYFNPFGNPLIVASTDNSVLVVMTYNQATIQWKGTTTTGQISGTLGANTPVSGVMSMVSSENEDLVKGTAGDSGTLYFASMTPANLDASGSYSGTSVIPTGGYDCSAFTGLPGTCTMTGFQSVGKYGIASSNNLHIDGTYSTQWGVPALGYGAILNATTTQG